ncbi:MAG TPA: hypothetical protein VNO21_07680, partial [Polyangiaceae bacterium]|nr:hypothetical protein [Polyangiaceae bacterium]
SGTLLHERSVPEVMRWEPIAPHANRTAITFTVLHVVAALTGLAVAFRRRDRVSLALLVIGIFGEVISIAALRAIVGEVHDSLIFWTTAPSVVVWMGALSAAVAAAADAIARRRAIPWPTAARALAGAGLLAAISTTMLQRSWVTRFPDAPGSYSQNADMCREIYEAVRTHSAQIGAVPVLHLMGDWGLATTVALEHEKDAAELRFADVDAWSFAGGRTAAGAPRVWHVWFSSTILPVPLAPCLHPIARVRNYVDILESTTDLQFCPATAR